MESLHPWVRNFSGTAILTGPAENKKAPTLQEQDRGNKRI
jgi:hypothetical protein